MALARLARGPQIGVASEVADGSEFERVLRMSDPGPALVGALTFSPANVSSAEGWLTAWRAWEERVFVSLLAPKLVEVFSQAAQGRAREIAELDRELDASPAAMGNEASRAAGRRLLIRLAPSRGERWLDKLVQWAAKDELPGHFATVFSVQYALFHLPLRLLVPAYAYWEWTAATSVAPVARGLVPEFAREAERLCRLAGDLLPSPFTVHAVHPLPAAAGER